VHVGWQMGKQGVGKRLGGRRVIEHMGINLPVRGRSPGRRGARRAFPHQR
jgi:hypothetical protein